MRSWNTVLIVTYFLALVIGSVLFYKYSYPTIIDPDTQNQAFAQSSNRQVVYFSSEGKLFSFNSSVLLDRIGQPEKVQITDEKIQGLSFAPQEVFASVTDKNMKTQIADFKNNSKETVVSAKTSGFENMSAFSDPRLSPNHKNLLFRASHAGTDYLFTKSLQTNTFTNITQSQVTGKIISSAWSPDGAEIAFSAEAKNSYVLLTVNFPASGNQNIIRESNLPIDQIIWSKNGIFYLETTTLNNQSASNLYFLNLRSKQAKAISSVAYPSTVTDFDVSPDGQSVVFSIFNQETTQNNLNLAHFDGTNLLQITEDTSSFFPTFSPDSAQIVFWRKGEGLFTINTDKTGLKKIYNESAEIQKIFAWRRE